MVDGEASLDEFSRAQIAKTLQWWAEVHPRRDQPVLERADGSQLTPRTIATAVRYPGSPIGEPIFEMFALGMADTRRDGPRDLDQVLQVFIADAQRWSEERGDER